MMAAPEVAMARTAIEPQPGMSQAVRCGRHIFLSGQVAFDEAGHLVGEGDAAAQAEQVLRNIERLLAKAGAGLQHVARLTCYLTDASHFPAYAAAKRRYFPVDPPAGTSVVVAQLLDPRLLLEVEALAVVDA
jgi:enamine deaminase RidA (YjgF/YER057c/UK114 family)